LHRPPDGAKPIPMHSEESPSPEEPSPPRPRSRFPTTRWTLIRRISEGDASERQAALGEVCLLYWPPIYAYFRALGKAEHDAEDLTQGFFEHLLKGGAFDRLDVACGKLRAYLLQSARNYLSGHRRRASAGKRGGGIPVLVLDPEQLKALAPWLESSSYGAPDLAFDRLWAATVLETAYGKVARRYRERGAGELFEVLAPAIRADGVEIDPTAAADSLGLNESAFRVALHRLRRAYRGALRDTVAETLVPGEDLEEELRQLMALFA